jgi:competence protein ComEA
MSFYRTLLAALAAVVIAAPVFADDTATTTNENNQATQGDTAGTDAQQVASTEQGSTEQKVNINTATAKDLMKVKGLNAAKARAIVSYRKKHGDFKSVEDLSSVKAFKKIKPTTLKDIEGQLTIE